MADLETINCNICGSSGYKVIYEPRYGLEKDKDLHVKFRSSGDETLIDQLVQCEKCGLIYINPRFKADLIIDSYSEGTDDVFVSQVEGREKTFAKCLKKIEKFYPKAGKLLDIGTAGGSFLHVAKQMGWDVYGCEPNRWLCNWCKDNYGIEIKNGTVFEQGYPDDYFDVVTLWDVLEHTPDPKRVLKECSRILKKNGLLVINYPDIGSWISKLMGKKWVFLLSVHLYYFTRNTISRILGEAGFSVVSIKPHYQQLGLEYVINRSKSYIGALGGIAERIVKFSGLGNLNISYWIGQTLVIAKKGA